MSIDEQGLCMHSQRLLIAGRPIIHTSNAKNHFTLDPWSAFILYNRETSSAAWRIWGASEHNSEVSNAVDSIWASAREAGA